MTSFEKKSTIARRGISGVTALLCLVIIMAFSTTSSAPPKHTRPFKGSYNVALTIPKTDLVQDLVSTGEGNATHLGRFVFHSLTHADFTDLDNITVSGGTETNPVTFTAANGDELYLTFSGTGQPNDDNTYTVIRNFEIIGGTGRFEGADGSFSSTSTAAFTTTAESVSLAGTVYFTGTISY